MIGLKNKILKNKKPKNKRNWRFALMRVSDRGIALVLDCFEEIDEAITYVYIEGYLSENGFDIPDRVIRSLIEKGILQIDRFQPEVYLALTSYGERLWEELY